MKEKEKKEKRVVWKKIWLKLEKSWEKNFTFLLNICDQKLIKKGVWKKNNSKQDRFWSGLILKTIIQNKNGSGLTQKVEHLQYNYEVENLNKNKKSLVDGWMDGWIGKIAVLRIAYSNQNQ